MQQNNVNVENIVANYKETLNKKEEVFTKTGSLLTGAALGAVMGSLLPGVGAPIGAFIGNFAGKIYGKIVSRVYNKAKVAFQGKRSVFSDLGGEDKGNLVRGFAMEAIYEKGLTEESQVRTYVTDSLWRNKILYGEHIGKFYPNNEWANTTIRQEIALYKDTVAKLKRTIQLTQRAVENFETAKQEAYLWQTIYKAKNKVNLTDEETQLLKSSLAYARLSEPEKVVYSVNIQKGLKGNKNG